MPIVVGVSLLPLMPVGWLYDGSARPIWYSGRGLPFD